MLRRLFSRIPLKVLEHLRLKSCGVGGVELSGANYEGVGV